MNRSGSCGFVPYSSIALDLDETLVFVTMAKPQSGNFFTVRVRRRTMYVQMRPGLLDFLSHVRKLFDVFFFTAAQSDYANQVIDRIAPGVPPCRRLCRDSCRLQAGYFVKDLKLLRRSLNRVILIDDVPGSALTNPENLIRVTPWNGDQKDDVLLSKLLPILRSIAHEENLSDSARQIMAKSPCSGVDVFPGLPPVANDRI
jgi:Dullard-like phosphatase family protein